MKMIFHTRSDVPEYNADCDCAVVDLDPALIEQIQRRVKLAQTVFEEDNDLYELYFWGGMAEFYDHRLLEACEDAVAAGTAGDDGAKSDAVRAWSDALDQNEYARLPEGVDLPAHQAQSTECDQLIVRRLPRPDGSDFEVTWLAIPKHSDIYVMTSNLPLIALDAAKTVPTSPEGISGGCNRA